MALLNEFEQHLHYQRAKPALCLQFLELAPCVGGQGAELLLECLLELVPRLGVPAPLEFFESGAHSLVRYYRAKLGIGYSHKVSHALRRRGFGRAGSRANCYHFLKGVNMQCLKSSDGIKRPSRFLG